MKRLLMFSLVVGLIAALWFAEATRVLATVFFWSPFVAVPLVLAIMYHGTPANKRQRLQAEIQNRWLLWYPPFMLALVTTTAVVVAGFAGMSVPYFGWGLRGTPWGYVYAIHFFVWSLATTIIALHQSWLRVEVATFAGDWIRRGGCWMIWSKDNWPANSFLVLYGVVVIMTLLYGMPSPDVDVEMVAYDTQKVAAQAVNSEFVQTAQAKINDLLGQEVFALAVDGPLLRPEPRFVRGWGWVRLTFVLTPLALLGLMFSRRDEASVMLLSFAHFCFRRRDALSGEGAASGEEEKEPEGAKAEAEAGEAKAEKAEAKAEKVKAKAEGHEPPTVIKFPSLASRFFNELLSEVAGRAVYEHLGNFAESLGKKLSRVAA